MKNKFLVELEVFVNSDTDKEDVKYAFQNMIKENFIDLTNGKYFINRRIAPGKINVRQI